MEIRDSTFQSISLLQYSTQNKFSICICPTFHKFSQIQDKVIFCNLIMSELWNFGFPNEKSAPESPFRAQGPSSHENKGYWYDLTDATLTCPLAVAQSFNLFLLFVIDYWIVTCNHEKSPLLDSMLLRIIHWTSQSQLFFTNWLKTSIHKTQMATPRIYLMWFAFQNLIFLFSRFCSRQNSTITVC